jgi:hypothetical protein
MEIMKNIKKKDETWLGLGWLLACPVLIGWLFGRPIDQPTNQSNNQPTDYRTKRPTKQPANPYQAHETKPRVHMNKYLTHEQKARNHEKLRAITKLGWDQPTPTKQPNNHKDLSFSLKSGFLQMCEKFIIYQSSSSTP